MGNLLIAVSWISAVVSPTDGHYLVNPIWRGKPGPGKTDGMKPLCDPHYRHRFPAEIISHAVWLYHVFSLSFRNNVSNHRGRFILSFRRTLSSTVTSIHAAT
jgi:hypothetical protein